MRGITANNHLAPGVPVAHTFDRYGADIIRYNPTPYFNPLLYTYVPDSVGKQTRPLQVARAYLFDGVDDTVTYPVGNAVFNNNLEIEFYWIPTNVSSFKQILYVGYDGTSGQAGGWYVDQSGTGQASKLRILFYTSNTTNQSIFSSAYTLVVSTTYLVKIRLVPAAANATTVTLTISPLNGPDNIETFSIPVPIVWPSVTNLTRLNFHAGKVWGFKITNLATGALILFAKCDEGYNTTSYDSAGNGYHGTLANITLLSFHATQSVYCYQNEAGYNLRGTEYTKSLSSGTADLTISNFGTGSNSYVSPELRIQGTGGFAQVIIGYQIAVAPPQTYFLLTMRFRVVTGNFVLVGSLANSASQTTSSSIVSIVMKTGNNSGGANSASFPGPNISTSVALDMYITSFTLTPVEIIPRNESVTLQDIAGTALGFKDRVKYNVWLKGSYCGTFSGSQYVDVGNQTSLQINNFILCFFVRRTSNSTGKNILAIQSSTGNTGIIIGHSGAASTTLLIGSGASSLPIPLPLNVWHYIVTWRIGNAIYANVNNTQYQNLSALNMVWGASGSSKTILGGLWYQGAINEPFIGNLMNVQYAPYSSDDLAIALNQGTMKNTLLNIAISEGGGLMTFDNSPSKFHGSITGATLATFWGTRQDYFHYNFFNAFYKGVAYLSGNHIETVASWVPKQVVVFEIDTIFPSLSNLNNLSIGFYTASTDRWSISFNNASGYRIRFNQSTTYGDVAVTVDVAQIPTSTGVYPVAGVPYKVVIVMDRTAPDNNSLQIYLNGILSHNYSVPTGFNLSNKNTFYLNLDMLGNSAISNLFTVRAYDFNATTPTTAELNAILGLTFGDRNVPTALRAKLTMEFLGENETPGGGWADAITGTIVTKSGTVNGFRIPSTAMVLTSPVISPIKRSVQNVETQIDFQTGVASPVAVLNGLPSTYTYGASSFPSKGNAYYESFSNLERNFLLYGFSANTLSTQMKMRRFLRSEPVFKVWFDAAICVKDSNNKVSQLTNLNGSNHALQPLAASQPLWVANQLNTYPVIRFDGVDDWLEWTPFDVRNTTFFIVFKANALSYYNMIVGNTNTGVSSGPEGYMRQWNRGTGQLEHPNPLNQPQFQAYDTIYQRGVKITPITDVSFSGSGVYALPVAITSFSYYSMFNNYPNDIRPYALGRNGNNNTFASMDVAEMMFVQGLLTLNQTKAIESYFKAKYALP